MANLGLESRPPDFCSMRGKVVFISGEGDISHSVRCLALGNLARKDIYISRQKDICFTFVYGPFARKINSIFAARGWGKDSVLFKPHSMNLKQDISSDGLRYFSSIWFHMENICRATQG